MLSNIYLLGMNPNWEGSTIIIILIYLVFQKLEEFYWSLQNTLQPLHIFNKFQAMNYKT